MTHSAPFGRPLLCIACLLACFLLPLAASGEEASPKANGEPVASASAAKPSSADLKADENYELLRLFADTLDQVERNYVKEIDRRELMEAAIRGMMSKLDPYSSYIPPEELDRFRSSVENEFGGIGVTVSAEGGELTIISPLYRTPAYRAGIRGGDVITEIDGKSAAGISIGEAIRRMKGAIGTSVKVTIKHAANGRVEMHEIPREVIRVDSVLGDHRQADDSWSYFLDEPKKIAYIRITSFSRHTVDDLRTVLGDLQRTGLKGLVLDLRFNPGGLLTSAIETCDLFVSEGRIVSTSGRNAPQRIWDAKKDGTFDGFPMAVLVNHYSASASEIVSACLQDHQRAVVIGQRTWGKGSVQNIIELEDGKSAMKLTTAGYLRPSGKNIHRFEGAAESDDWGVRPNAGFEITMTEDEMSKLLAERRRREAIVAPANEGTKSADGDRFVDPQLGKAVEYIEQQLAAKQAAGETKPADDGKAATE